MRYLAKIVIVGFESHHVLVSRPSSHLVTPRLMFFKFLGLVFFASLVMVVFGHSSFAGSFSLTSTMLAIEAFFVVGAVGFWLVLAAVSVVLWWSMDTEMVGVPVAAWVVGAAVLMWANHFHVGEFVKQNWPWFVPVVVGYLLIGTGWAVAKWWLFITKFREAYNEVEQKHFLKARVGSVAEMSAEQLMSLRQEAINRFRSIAHNSYSSDGTFAFPVAAHKKAMIMGWMMYWPYSITWFLFNDPIRRLFTHIYLQISGGLDRMTARMTGDITAKLALDTKPGTTKAGRAEYDG